MMKWLASLLYAYPDETLLDYVFVLRRICACYRHSIQFLRNWMDAELARRQGIAGRDEPVDYQCVSVWIINNFNNFLVAT